MDSFFGMIASIIKLLNGWKIIGSLSVWEILLTTLVATVIIKLLKGRKSND